MGTTWLTLALSYNRQGPISAQMFVRLTRVHRSRSSHSRAPYGRLYKFARRIEALKTTTLGSRPSQQRPRVRRSIFPKARGLLVGRLKSIIFASELCSHHRYSSVSDAHDSTPSMTAYIYKSNVCRT